MVNNTNNIKRVLHRWKVIILELRGEVQCSQTNCSSRQSKSQWKVAWLNWTFPSDNYCCTSHFLLPTYLIIRIFYETKVREGIHDLVSIYNMVDWLNFYCTMSNMIVCIWYIKFHHVGQNHFCLVRKNVNLNWLESYIIYNDKTFNAISFVIQCFLCDTCWVILKMRSSEFEHK